MNVLDAFRLGLTSNNQKALEVLKKQLTDNGFKHSVLSAEVMLNEYQDLGLEDDVVAFYKAVAYRYLPERVVD